MILRSRSTITLPLFQDNVQPSDSKIDINSIGTPPRSSMKNINAQSTHNSGGSTTNLRLLKYIVGIALLACVLLYITMMQSINDPDRHRTVRGKPQQRILTVVMNTFKRHDLMIEAIDYYSNCECVQNIHVIWSEKDPPPQRIVAKYKENDVPRVIFSIQEIDSLNNRFKPLNDPHTDAIFSVDDDMRVPCNELDLALEVWKGSSKSIVGFMPRVHLRQSDGLHYRCWWRVWWEGAYSIILTKAAILHHDYFHAYFNILPKEVHQLVDKRRNCEDIAMQYLVSNMTSLPPIYVKGHLGDKGALNGISTKHNVIKAGHMQQRDDCLNDLEKIFHRDPLVLSHIVVDSAANGWTHSPSTWFEYLSSDLWKW